MYPQGRQESNNAAPLRAQDNPDEVEELNKQVIALYQQGKFAEAVPLAQQVMEIRKRTVGEDGPAYASSLNNLAALYRAQGKYAQAESLYKRSLAIREKALGRDDPQVAASLNDLAELYTEQGKYADAEPLYKRSLAIREKALGPDRPDVATSLNNLANLCWRQGKYAEAEPLYKRSLAIREKTLGPAHPAVATSLNNLAELYRVQGKYAEAEPLYKRSVVISEKSLGPDHPAVATSLNNLALLYEAQGKHAEAEPLYKRSLGIREKALGPDCPDVATSLNNLANLYWRQGKYAEAEPLYKHSLAIREKALEPDHPYVANSLNNLANLYSRQGKYAEAEPLYKHSLAIREKVLGPDHPDVATSLNNLANLCWRQGKYAEAEPLYKRSLAIREKVLGPDHPAVATSLNNLAGLYWSQDKHVEADLYFERGLQSLSQQFATSFSYMSEKDRLAFLATASYVLPAYFSFSITYNQRMPELAVKVYDLLLWEKGMVANSVAAQRARIAASGDAEALKLLDQLIAKRKEYAALASVHPANYEQWRKRLELVGEEANGLEKELARRCLGVAEQEKMLHPSWRNVQKILKPDEAALEYVRFPFYDGKQWTGKSYYVALVVRRDSRLPQWVTLGEAKELEGPLLAEYRRSASLARCAREPESAEAKAVGRSAFYNASWKPLESALAGAHRIYISPDGVLSQVSLAVVRDDQDRLLTERYDLRTVNSTKDLLREHREPSNKDAVLVGNPTFPLSEKQQPAALQKSRQTNEKATVLLAPATTFSGPGATQSRDMRAERGICGTPPARAIRSVPGTAAEIESVSDLLKKNNWQVTTYHDETALEEVVKAVRHPRVLHLAAHGFFLANQRDTLRSGMMGNEENRATGMEDPMLRSGLLLAGAGRVYRNERTPKDLDDEVLMAYEASTLDLQGTELVVLSGCEMGLGEQQNGERVFGLRRALQEAGAEAVLMSMWSVPDTETQELMTKFYGHWLSGMEKPEALRRAQVEEHETVKKRYGKDLPYYWGAFVLVGR